MKPEWIWHRPPRGTRGGTSLAVHQQPRELPGLVFVMLGSLDKPELIAPKLEMFTRRRLKWARPLDLPQFNSMPS